MVSNLQAPTEGGSEGPPEPFGVLGAEAGRDQKTGRFARGNTAAVVHGRYSATFWAEVAGEQSARRAAILRDKGYGDGDAPETLRAVVDGAVQAVLMRDAAFDRVVEAGGPISLRGRNRAAFKVWLEAGDRAERYLRLLGLERKMRQAPSPLEYWQRRQQQGEGV